MPEPRGPHFITVDLEVLSREDLASLAAAVEPEGFVLHVGKIGRKFLVSIGAKAASRLTTPEQTIWALLDVVDALPPGATRLWKHAQSRVFNIGYEGGEFVTLLYERPVGSGRWYAGGRRKAGPCETTLSPELLRAVASVDGMITTTIHPPRKEVPSRRRKRRSSAAVKRPA
jgi:hypothetical protein